MSLVLHPTHKTVDADKITNRIFLGAQTASREVEWLKRITSSIF